MWKKTRSTWKGGVQRAQPPHYPATQDQRKETSRIPNKNRTGHKAKHGRRDFKGKETDFFIRKRNNESCITETNAFFCYARVALMHLFSILESTETLGIVRSPPCINGWDKAVTLFSIWCN
jgi:hypothetical protein